MKAPQQGECYHDGSICYDGSMFSNEEVAESLSLQVPPLRPPMGQADRGATGTLPELQAAALGCGGEEACDTLSGREINPGILLASEDATAILEGRKSIVRLTERRWMGIIAGDRIAVIELRHVRSFPNRDYAAGSDGRIYSRTHSANHGKVKRLRPWYPLKATLGSRDYPLISVCHLNNRRTVSVHSLVCEAFYGPRPTPGHQVRHLDGNRWNSNPGNLCWGTQSENWVDRKAHGKGIEGQKHHCSKLSDEQRSHVRWAISQGLCSQRHASRTLGISQSAIWNMLSGAELNAPEPSIPERYAPILIEAEQDAREERLQEITEAEAAAEGCRAADFATGMECLDPSMGSRLLHFRSLWELLHDVPGERWADNPVVVRIAFRKVEAT